MLIIMAVCIIENFVDSGKQLNNIYVFSPSLILVRHVAFPTHTLRYIYISAFFILRPIRTTDTERLKAL